MRRCAEAAWGGSYLHFRVFTPNRQACIVPAKTHRVDLFIQFSHPDIRFSSSLSTFRLQAFISNHSRLAAKHALLSARQNSAKPSPVPSFRPSNRAPPSPLPAQTRIAPRPQTEPHHLIAAPLRP